MCTGMLPGERRLGAGLICGVGVEILFSLLGGELKPSCVPHRKPEPWAVRIVEVGILQLIPNNLFCACLLVSVIGGMVKFPIIIHLLLIHICKAWPVPSTALKDDVAVVGLSASPGCPTHSCTVC